MWQGSRMLPSPNIVVTQHLGYSPAPRQPQPPPPDRPSTITNTEQTPNDRRNPNKARTPPNFAMCRRRRPYSHTHTLTIEADADAEAEPMPSRCPYSHNSSRCRRQCQKLRRVTAKNRPPSKAMEGAALAGLGGCGSVAAVRLSRRQRLRDEREERKADEASKGGGEVVGAAHDSPPVWSSASCEAMSNDAASPAMF